MSLFEDSRYLYRDTLFVFLQKGNRPALNDLQNCLSGLGEKYRFQIIKTTEKDGVEYLESGTLFSPQDYSAMDIVYVQGPEVQEQVAEIFQDFKTVTVTGEDRKKLEVLTKSDARFDIFHFGEVITGGDDDEILDPGGLLLVLERLAELTHGVSFDPQSQDLN